MTSNHLGKVWASMALLAAAAFSTGCSMSLSDRPAPSPFSGSKISGDVHGGQQPVSGATIQLYAANSSTLKGPSSALLTRTVTTDSRGNFSISGDYTCPTPDSIIYIVATGGNPGLTGSNVNNSGIALMAAIGKCSVLTSATFLSINELSTVASVQSIAPFMADLTHIGADTSNPNGLVGAVSGATALVSLSTGTIASAAKGITQPVAILDTLADVLAACVNTSGGTAGDSTACGKLFQYAGTGSNTNTIAALLNIVQHPSQNVSQLFGLVPAGAPFQPTLPSAPGDFTAPLVITLPKLTTSLPQGYFVTTTADQNIWVYISADSPVQGSASYQYATGVIQIYDTNGTLLHTINPGSGGLYLPYGGSADIYGNVWVANLNGTMSKFGPDGAPLSPPGGYAFPFNFPPNLGYGPGFEGDDISSIASDTAGNIWGISTGAGATCYNELNSSGAAIVPSGNFCGQTGNNIVAEAVADGAGNIWFLGTNSMSKVSPSGNLLVNGVTANGCFDFYPAGSSMAGSDTLNLAYDRFHNQVWGIAPFGIGALRSDGTQVFCDTNAQNLPLIPASIAGNKYQVLEAIVSTVDGAGNLWFASGGESANGSSVSLIGGLNELDPNGNLLTPFSAAAGIYGLQVANTLQPGINNGGVQGLAIDAYGNIWSASNTNLSLTKIPGLAAPKNYQ